MDPDLEIAFFPGNGGNLRQGKQLDVDVSADLDQLGGDNSHGTVIGRECLIQLSHAAADGRGFFHQVDVKTRIGQIQSRLHARNAATYDHNRADLIFS